MNKIRSFLSDENGVATIMVTLAMVALMGMTALAVDLGRAYVKRAALQTAADAGALAGANSIVSEGTDLADIKAIISRYANRNMKNADAPALALTDADIVFMNDGVPDETNPNMVEVTITLSSARGNPFPLYFGTVIGVPVMDIVVVARAGIINMCASKCVMPFVVPTDFEWDDLAAPGTQYYDNGQYDVASPQELASVTPIGYTHEDIGTQIVIKPGDPSDAIAPGQYNLIDLPPLNKGTPTTGAAMVRENIMGCTGSSSEATVGSGDELLLEPGNSKGPVVQGVTDLISQDSTAYWDESTQTVKGSSEGDPLKSPRVAIIAFYDPRYPPVSGRNSLVVYQLGAFFIESVSGNGDVTARFMYTLAKDPDSSSDDCLLKTSRVMLDSGRQ